MDRLISSVAKAMTSISADTFAESCPISIIDINKWEWAQGVGMFGMYRYYEESKSDEVFDYIKKWYDLRIEEGLPSKNVNTCAPMLTLTYIYETTKEEKYLSLIEEWSMWIMIDLIRTKDGGFQHMVSGSENKNQLWDDTLFMAVLFLARAGVILNNDSYIEECKYQFLIHIKYLYDNKTGLWFHGWTFEENNNFANALWGRGNCWYTIAVTELVETLDLKESALYRYFVTILENQANALIKYQNENGLWHTIINDSSSYTEVSASAGFAYGIFKAVRNGLLDKKYIITAQKAADAIIKKIDENGTVTDVSYGTGMGKSIEEYKNIELCPMTYGQALTILCLTEYNKYLKTERNKQI